MKQMAGVIDFNRVQCVILIEDSETSSLPIQDNDDTVADF